MDIQNQLAAVEAANVTLSTENAQLRQALRAIRKGLSEDSDGEFWPARRWLDARKIYHGDLSGNRVLELVAKHALHGKLDDESLAAFTPAEPPQQETKVLRAPTTEAETVADPRGPDCGACAEVLYTGVTTNQHTCEGPRAEVQISYEETAVTSDHGQDQMGRLGTVSSAQGGAHAGRSVDVGRNTGESVHRAGVGADRPDSLPERPHADSVNEASARVVTPAEPQTPEPVICSCGTVMVCPDIGCDKHKPPVSSSARPDRQTEDKDSGAGLIGHVASPLAETLPRPSFSVIHRCSTHTVLIAAGSWVNGDKCQSCGQPLCGSAPVPISEALGSAGRSAAQENLSQEQADARPARTLKDYRPQHDEDCGVRVCAKCPHPWAHRGLGRTCEIAVGECRTTGEQELCGCVFTPKPCSCGLDALLSGGAPHGQ